MLRLIRIVGCMVLAQALTACQTPDHAAGLSADAAWNDVKDRIYAIELPVALAETELDTDNPADTAYACAKADEAAQLLELAKSALVTARNAGTPESRDSKSLMAYFDTRDHIGFYSERIRSICSQACQSEK